jgi:hypothetical protein
MVALLEGNLPAFPDGLVLAHVDSLDSPVGAVAVKERVLIPFTRQ